MALEPTYSGNVVGFIPQRSVAWILLAQIHLVKEGVQLLSPVKFENMSHFTNIYNSLIYAQTEQTMVVLEI